MRKMLIVLFGVLAFQGTVFAETWEDRAANKIPSWWKAETVLNSIMKGFAPTGQPRKLYIMAWYK